jgi:hypothetical protein
LVKRPFSGEVDQIRKDFSHNTFGFLPELSKNGWGKAGEKIRES